MVLTLVGVVELEQVPLEQVLVRSLSQYAPSGMLNPGGNKKDEDDEDGDDGRGTRGQEREVVTCGHSMASPLHTFVPTASIGLRGFTFHALFPQMIVACPLSPHTRQCG
jgi:hypothetical protein